MPNLVSLTFPSLQILGTTQLRLFPISDQLLLNKSCHISRTSNDIDIKLGSVTKLDKRNTKMLKRFDDDVMSEYFDVTVIFSIYGQFGAIQRSDSGRMVSNTYIFINSNLFKKFLILLLWVKVLFLLENPDLLQKKGDIKKKKKRKKKEEEPGTKR